jgi:hypothetical protein
MAEININFADVQDKVSGDERAIITGRMGGWMFKLAKLVQAVSGVSISWWTGSGRFALGPTDVLLYVISDVDRSVIEATGGSAKKARDNSKVLGLTQVDPANKRALSELYWGRAMRSSGSGHGPFQSELAGAAFHETAHNKSLQDDGMHNGKDGLLVAAPFYGSDPTPKNLDFLAQFILANVSQNVVAQNVLTKWWFGGGSSSPSP